MAETMTPDMLEYYASSWIYLILFTVFFLVCLRVRGNFKFIGAFFRDLTEVRERENMLDATVKETSFIFLLLLLSGLSIGVLLSRAAEIFGGTLPIGVQIPPFGLDISGEFTATAISMGLACGYIGAMWVVYTVVGRVFSDPLHTWLWVRGFTAGAGLGAAVFFPLALVALAYPEQAKAIIAIALVMLILVKILFIIKGFRIFFTESSLWVVFLYYLCSLEIVPLVITFGLACALLG